MTYLLYIGYQNFTGITIILDTYVRVFAANSDRLISSYSTCACLLEVTTVPMCLRLSRLQIGSLLYEL
jgi:hypothetical protein